MKIHKYYYKMIKMVPKPLNNAQIWDFLQGWIMASMKQNDNRLNQWYGLDNNTGYIVMSRSQMDIEGI